MIYMINAVALAWVASFWSKSGGLNIAIATVFVVLAIVNAGLASPFVLRIVGVAS